MRRFREMIEYHATVDGLTVMGNGEKFYSDGIALAMEGGHRCQLHLLSHGDKSGWYKGANRPELLSVVYGLEMAKNKGRIESLRVEFDEVTPRAGQIGLAEANISVERKVNDTEYEDVTISVRCLSRYCDGDDTQTTINIAQHAKEKGVTFIIVGVCYN